AHHLRRDRPATTPSGARGAGAQAALELHQRREGNADPLHASGAMTVAFRRFPIASYVAYLYMSDNVGKLKHVSMKVAVVAPIVMPTRPAAISSQAFSPIMWT